MSARTYACPSCGGLVDEQARRCRYCSAPVATVRCATCFHMNVPDAGYCSGCGRQLGLEPVGEPGTLSCPICKQTLSVYTDTGGMLFDCGQCGGQFVEHALLRGMLDRHARSPFPDTAKKLPGGPSTRASYIPCPECGSLMNRKNFGITSGVIVDVCKKHGIWFEADGLPRVIGFVAAGGLKKARQREAEEAARLRREAAVAAAAAQAQAPHAWSGGSFEPIDRESHLVELFMHLLGEGAPYSTISSSTATPRSARRCPSLVLHASRSVPAGVSSSTLTRPSSAWTTTVAPARAPAPSSIRIEPRLPSPDQATLRTRSGRMASSEARACASTGADGEALVAACASCASMNGII